MLLESVQQRHQNNLVHPYFKKIDLISRYRNKLIVIIRERHHLEIKKLRMVSRIRLAMANSNFHSQLFLNTVLMSWDNMVHR